MKRKANLHNKDCSRRDFMKASAAVGMAAILSGNERLFASGSDQIRIGIIGCGFRGTGALTQALTCSEHPVKLWAIGDLFADRIEKCIKELSEGGKKEYDRQSYPPLVDKMDVPPERQFAGFDAYQKVIDSGVDIVLLAEPPGFRPMHLAAAVKAGKHVFMEKPAAVDPVGVRSIIASSELASRKGLSIVAGTQRRYDPIYIETIKRIHRGDIGEVVGGQCYFNSNELWFFEKQEGWSDMEWQCRNWIYFTWLSGDHIVEQHIHNIDIMNWAIGSHPVKCMGMGGRQVRTAPTFGNIYDHFAVEYEYQNGVRVLSMCRQTNGCTIRIGENIVGTRGTAKHGVISGAKPYKYSGPMPNPYLREHAELVRSVLEGKPINDGKQVAESTLAAIMGRMSAYTGRALKWDWAMKASKLDLSPARYEFGDLPVGPVAMPGKTQLI